MNLLSIVVSNQHTFLQMYCFDCIMVGCCSLLNFLVEGMVSVIWSHLYISFEDRIICIRESCISYILNILYFNDSSSAEDTHVLHSLQSCRRLFFLIVNNFIFSFNY